MNQRDIKRLRVALAGCVLGAGMAGPAGAVTLGMADTFEGAGTEGWSSGFQHPAPPSLVATGGPTGDGDGFLLLQATGNAGAGGRLVAFSGPQWGGDYAAAGITGIRMSVRNFGATDLALRLAFDSGAVSKAAVPVAAGSAWHEVVFPLLAADMTGSALGQPFGFRLIHATGPNVLPNVAAQLGVDNITAVPEPASLLLLAGGLAALAAGARQRQRRQRRSSSAMAALVTVLVAGASSSTQAATGLDPIGFGSLGIKLQAVATGLSAPDYATFAPGDPTRLYVVEQNGLLRVIENGSLLANPAMDIRGRVSPPLNPANANDERGFLGLAFHPDFNHAGSAGYQTLYTYTSESIAGAAPTFVAPNGANQVYKNVVAEWKMGAGGVVDPTSRRELMSFGKNAGNHNGGTIAFGGDGYLYLGLGDGGNANDVGPSHIEPGGNSQNLSTPLGKMLRIDPINPTLSAGSANAVSANGQYRIPTGNPFQGAGQVAETFALGFRNPYRFSFDRASLGGTGDLILADVGQNNVEEIDRVVVGGNYGWAVKEGTFVFHRTDPDGPGPLAAGSIGPRAPGDPSGLIDPIQGTLGTLEYDHTQGISITGGFVYRGDDIAYLQGKYIFGDLALTRLPTNGVRVDGRIFYADLVTGEIKEFLMPQFAGNKLPDGLTVHGFGEDAEGELYALVTNTAANGTGGIVYRISAVPEPGTWAMLGLGGLLLAGRLRRKPLQASAKPA